jgi:iron complex outermembrane receptor protein
MKFGQKKTALALGIGGLVMIAGGSVTAQDMRISVTGSNIKRVDAESASPIETITRADIEASGLNTIADVVHQITANNNGSISNAFINGFAAGAAGVSLRGLGANNTLVLLNGRRLASYGLADDGQRSFVDLNQIPFDVVERIDVLKSGASAVYGSDAVAGVVNIITRSQFTGGVVSATGGTTYKGDGNNFRGSLTLGTGDLTKDNYNAFIVFDGQKQNAIETNNRPGYIGSLDLTRYGLPDLRPGTLGTGNANNPNSLSSSSLVGNVRPVNNKTGGSPGPYQSLPGCAPSNLVGPENLCAWDFKDYLQIQPEQQQFNVYAKGAYNFTSTLQGYTELSYFQSKLTGVYFPTNTNSTWYDYKDSRVIASTTFFMPVGHPDNPYNDIGKGARLRYYMGDVGGRNTDYQTDTQRYLVGLKGVNWDWDWDAGVMYVQSKTNLDQHGYVNYNNLTQAINGQGGFGYYRVGVNASLNQPGIYNFIAPDLQYQTKSSVTQFDFKASRDLMKMDGGAMALAVGGGYRHESESNPGSPGTFDGSIMGLGYSQADASRNVTDVYGELYMPIFKNLEATAAVRFDHYSDAGSATTPLVSAKWTVMPEVVLRGTYAQGFRAPGAYENGNSATVGFTTYVDPVRCPVTGAAADCGGGNLAVVSKGNPAIQPEKSNTYTFGTVFEPFTGFSGSVDYWYIKTKQQIQQPDPQLTLNNPAGFPLNQIVRDPTTDLIDPDTGLPIPNTGTVQAVIGPYTNVSSVVTNGIDFDFLYRFPATDYGKFSAELQWTYTISFKRTINGETIHYENSHGPTALSSSAGMPQNRFNVILGWTQGPWTATGTVRYVDPIPQTESKGSDCLHPDLSCRAPSFTTLDLSAGYTGFMNWNIFGSVINVFNRKAPFDPQAGYGLYNYNYNYAQSGATGTQFNLGARYTFK